MDWLKSFWNFNVTPTRYLTRYVLPITLAGIVLGVLGFQFLRGTGGYALAVVFAVGAPAFALYVALMVPRIVTDRRRREIDDNIHFYITHMGVLAASNLPPVKIFEKLGEKKEYGALAAGSEEIASLVNSWNMGFPEACRFVAERTPSSIYADFLERLAYAIETGDDLLTFLKNEQKVVVAEYASQYQAQLYGVESVKELYLSGMMSVIFLVVFGLISPLLTGTDPGALIWAIAALIIILELVFLVLLVMRAPNDRVWSATSEAVGPRRNLRQWMPLSLLICALTGFLTAWLLPLSAMFVVAAATTPLAIVGYLAFTTEREIHFKEDNYPAFIRSLGSSTSARGGDAKAVLRRLARHDFGPLTGDIRALHRRLSLRLNDVRAWSRFAHETSSNLVDKFTAMFTEGVASGGDAGTTGTIVSNNVVQILGLRKQRRQSAGAFRGMMLGMTAGMAGTLFIGVGLLKVLEGLFGNLDTGTTGVDTGLFLSGFEVNVGLLQLIVTGVVLVHIIMASYMMVIAAGGSRYRMASYIPLLAWICAGAHFGAEYALRTF